MRRPYPQAGSPRNGKPAPLSTKVIPNWYPPNGQLQWTKGIYSITALGRSFRIEKPADEHSPSDWWQKDGEVLFSRAWSTDWPTIWRLHHDALEAGALGYCEGLGLLLWAFHPGEYLRRAEHLEVGPDERVNGGVYKTLIATPDWLVNKPFLERRTHYPFEESTFISWASLRPVVKYLIDAKQGTVAGAEFSYRKVVRTSPEDWEVSSESSGLRITCFATEVAQTPGGTWFPIKILGEAYQGAEVLRRTHLTVSLGVAPASLAATPLQAGKRKIDPWPFYSSEVYRGYISQGDVDHANIVGLARAVAFEGKLDQAEEAIKAAVEDLHADTSLLTDTFGGIDWELGFALYELFWRYDDAQLQALWSNAPRNSTWSAILARAVNLYQQFRPEDSARIEVLLASYEETFDAALRQQAEAEGKALYMEFLRDDISAAQASADRERTEYLQRLLSEVESAGK